MRYLLDTCVLIDASRGWQPVVARLERLIAQGDDLGLCSVIVAEFYSGLSVGKRAVWKEFIDGFSYWPIGRGAAEMAGTWRFDYARRGRTLSLSDTLIAAAAAFNSATLLTENTKDFPMSEVTVEHII